MGNCNPLRPLRQSFLKSAFAVKSHTGRIADLATVGPKQAIIPERSGRAWITGTDRHMPNPSDPFARGDRLTDTRGCGQIGRGKLTRVQTLHPPA